MRVNTDDYAGTKWNTASSSTSLLPGTRVEIFVALGLIVVVIGAALVTLRKDLPTWDRAPIATSVLTYLFLGVAVLGTAGAFLSTYSKYSSLVDAVRENRVAVVEGAVANFRPMPSGGHALEHFCVSGKCFSYSDYSVSAGFNNTNSHGGPIREGLTVRVTYVGNTITKLEVVGL